MQIFQSRRSCRIVPNIYCYEEDAIRQSPEILVRQTTDLFQDEKQPTLPGNSTSLHFDQAKVFMQTIPVPICIVDLSGNLLASNTEFDTTIWLDKVDAKSTKHMLHAVVSQDFDKLYIDLTKLAADTSSDHLTGNYMTHVMINAKRVNAPFDWTFAKVAGEDYLMVTGR